MSSNIKKINYVGINKDLDCIRKYLEQRYLLYLKITYLEGSDKHIFHD